MILLMIIIIIMTIIIVGVNTGALAADMGIHQRGVQWEGGAVDGDSTI